MFLTSFFQKHCKTLIVDLIFENIFLTLKQQNQKFTSAAPPQVCLMIVMVAAAAMEAAAVPKAGGQSKHSAKTHRKSAAAEVETVQLHLDPSVLVPSGNIRPLENASISPWTYK